MNIVAKMGADVVICRLCLEPLYNFICPDCLLDAAKEWLQQNSESDLIPAVEQRHKEMKALLVSDSNSMICIKCKRISSEWACPCCYLYEIYHIIKNSNLAKHRPELAQSFERIFNFDFNYRHGFTQLTFWQSLHKQMLSTRNFEPVMLSERKNRTDMNICDSCGQTAELKEINGEWLCESCRE